MNDANPHKNSPFRRPVRLRRRERSAGQVRQTSRSGMHDQQRSMRVSELHGGVWPSLSSPLYVFTLGRTSP
jgi:hypothetical protein